MDMPDRQRSLYQWECGSERDVRYYAVSFSEDGIRIFEMQKQEESFSSGCFLFLPFSLDEDPNVKLTDILNAVDKSKEEILKAFILDMEAEQSIFSEEAFYTKARASLHNHFLYHTLAAKYQYESWLQANVIDPIALLEYSRVEREWAECLMDPRAEKCLNESPWFDKTPAGYLKDMFETPHSCRSQWDKKEQNGRDVQTNLEQVERTALQWFMDRMHPEGALRILTGQTGKGLTWGLFICLILMCVALISLTILSLERLPYISYMNGVCWLKNSCLFLFLALCSCFVSIGLIARHRKISPTFIMRSILALIGPRLFAAIAAGWMTIGLSDIVVENIQADMMYHQRLIWVAIIVVITLGIFLYHSVSRQSPYESIWEKCRMSLVLLVLSFLYSTLIGAALLHIYGNYNYLFPPDIAYTHRAGILMVFTLISMFVGVFINLLFQEKS